MLLLWQSILTMVMVPGRRRALECENLSFYNKLVRKGGISVAISGSQGMAVFGTANST